MATETRTILVVDDEESIAELLVTLLDDKGYRVLSAANGEEGLDCAKREKIDIYLIDIMMPIIDGYEMVQELLARGTTPEKIIFMTAVPQAVLPDHFPGIAVMTKPFQIGLLLEMVERHLGYPPPKTTSN